MKRIVILVSVLLTSLVSAAWAQQTFTGNATTENIAQNENQQGAPCGTGCLCSPAGLIGWWAGDGNARDVQGVGLPCLKSYHVRSNGILMNGAKFAWGFVGWAFSFDGIDDYVNVPDTPALHTITTAVTVEAWINPQQTLQAPNFEGWILARRDPLVSEGFGISINDGGFMLTQFQTDVYSQFASADPGVVQFNGEWQHVALTVDTATRQVLFYVNGKPVTTVLIDGSGDISGSFASVSHLFIGQRESTDAADSCRYKGLIDEVGLYNRALTPEEIQAIYLVGHKGRCKASF